MRILALCGSLRAISSNKTALRAAALLAPDGVEVILFDGLAALPAFNPDLDGDDAIPPPPVAALRQAIGEAHALLISSPEYAHGIAGAFKNALDWLVSSFEFPEKPVALINTAPRAHHAQDQLREILTTMSARLVDEASITLPLGGRSLSAEEIAAEPALAGPLGTALRVLAHTVA